MTKLAITAFLIVAFCVVVAQARRNNAEEISLREGSSMKRPDASANPVPVIVELFTSEGCSSCPPADALLVRLEREQSIPGAEVVALEEHVDYWNNLGWADPFSSRELTDRQNRYAESFSRSGSYTPQMVVNGQSEFVGSRSDQAREAIADAAARPRTEVTIARTPQDSPGEWTVNVQKLPQDSRDTAEVWVAVTETHLHSNVEAGENAGRDLGHAAVVRQLSKLGVADSRKDQAFSGTAKLAIRPDWKKENVRLVAFVQERNSRHILGAASAKLVQ